MNILSFFKKIEKGAEMAVPVLSVFNPAAGLIVGSILHGVMSAQQLLPGPANNGLKKQIVTQIATSTAVSLGIQLAPAQTSALIEGILKGLQDAANAVPDAALDAAPAAAATPLTAPVSIK